MGFPQGSLGGLRESPGGSLNQGELEREIQDELEREIPGVPGRPRGVPGGCWGGPREAPGGPRGGPGRLRKHIKFSEGVWGGVQGGPWGDFGRLGWSSGPTWEVEMLIFRWF